MRFAPADRTIRSYELRKFFLSAALLCSLASAQAASPSTAAPASPALHPLMGSWIWTLPSKKCVETLNYRANGIWTGASGEETTQGTYEVPPVPSLLGFYRLVETLTVANGKRDCSGDLHEASSEASIRFIQLSPKRDQLIVCKAESLKECFGPLKRVAQ